MLKTNGRNLLDKRALQIQKNPPHLQICCNGNHILFRFPFLDAATDNIAVTAYEVYATKI
jgi:hypothetical protein